MTKKVPFTDLSTSDLLIDCIYEGGNRPGGGAGNDSLSKLLGCGNQGGFRCVGSVANSSLRFVVLTSSMTEPDWPDSLDEERGIFYLLW